MSEEPHEESEMTFDDDSDSNLTKHDIEAIELGSRASHLNANDVLWNQIRKNAILFVLGLAGFGGAGNIAWDKYFSDDSAKIMRNKMQIDNLGVEIVKVKEVNAAMPQYIIDSIKAKPGEVVVIPDVLKKNADEVERERVKAESGKLLEVSDEDVAKALAEVDK